MEVFGDIEICWNINPKQPVITSKTSILGDPMTYRKYIKSKSANTPAAEEVKVMDKLVSKYLLKLQTYAQVKQFIEEDFLPEDPHNDMIYQNQEISTKNVFHIVSNYTRILDDRPQVAFTKWFSTHRLSFLLVNEYRQLDLRKRNLFVMHEKYYVAARYKGVRFKGTLDLRKHRHSSIKSTTMRVANQRLHQKERFAIDNQIEDSRERHQRATLEFEKVFNLHKVISNAAKENRRFTNCIRTDGYAIDFVFAKKTNMDVLPNLGLEDFVPDEVQNTFRLWGLDPGLKSVFIAVDGHTNDQHEIRHFSTAEFYTFAGYKRTSRRLQNLKDPPQHLQVKQAESNLVSRPDVFHNFLMSFFGNVRVLLNFYSLDLLDNCNFTTMLVNICKW
ncbi:unnamed protein product [Rhizopus stolonifer]